MVNWACTTSKARGKHGEGLTAQAKDLCAELGIPVIARQNRGIPWLMEQYALECLLVEEDGGLLAHWGNGSASHKADKRWKTRNAYANFRDRTGR